VSLPVRVSSWFEDDGSRQTLWYLDRAGAAVALAYGEKVDATLGRIAEFPTIGLVRMYPQPELAGLRFLPVDEPFGRFLLFYQVLADELSAERLIHGTRDLPHRLLDPPGAE
jgi:plasmid stabilization system protein ParE